MTTSSWKNKNRVFRPEPNTFAIDITFRYEFLLSALDDKVRENVFDFVEKSPVATYQKLHNSIWGNLCQDYIVARRKGEKVGDTIWKDFDATLENYYTLYYSKPEESPTPSNNDWKQKFIEGMAFHYQVLHCVRAYYDQHSREITNKTFHDLDPFLKTFLYVNYDYLSIYSPTTEGGLHLSNLSFLEKKWEFLHAPSFNFVPDKMDQQEEAVDEKDKDKDKDKEESDTEDVILEETNNQKVTPSLPLPLVVEKTIKKTILQPPTKLDSNTLFGTGPPNPLYYYYDILDDVVFYHARLTTLLDRERRAKKKETQVYKIPFDDVFSRSSRRDMETMEYIFYRRPPWIRNLKKKKNNNADNKKRIK